MRDPGNQVDYDNDKDNNDDADDDDDDDNDDDDDDIDDHEDDDDDDDDGDDDDDDNLELQTTFLTLVDYCFLAERAWSNLPVSVDKRCFSK